MERTSNRLDRALISKLSDHRERLYLLERDAHAHRERSASFAAHTVGDADAIHLEARRG